jgi:hypothetical protein
VHGPDPADRGTVEISGNRFVYTPYQNKTGSDTFTYMAKDADGAWSAEATVTVDVQKYSGGPLLRHGRLAAPVCRGQAF